MIQSRSTMAAALVLTALFGGCGGGDDRSSFSDDDLAKARSEGRAQERLKEQQRKTAKLEKQIEQIKKDKKSNRTSTTIVVPGGGGSSSGGGGSSSGGSGNCGGGLSVNRVTTCTFAQSVRATYNGRGPGTYSVFSAATGRSYAMYCRGSSPVVCTGGNNAYVSFG